MRETAQTFDFFRPRLAEMIDLRHPLAVLATRLPWAQIEAALAPCFARRVRDGRVLAQDDRKRSANPSCAFADGVLKRVLRGDRRECAGAQRQPDGVDANHRPSSRSSAASSRV